MADRGEPMSYMTLEAGTPVLASDGTEVGKVAHVLADADADIFDGIVIDTRHGHRFCDAPEVARIAAGRVTLSLDADAVRRLPQPSGSPASMSADPDDASESDLTRKLRRAWDMISGRY